MTEAERRGGRVKSESLVKFINFRARPSLHATVAEAAKREARSISEEVEFRLSRSFQNEAAIAEIFGEPAQRPLMLALCNAIRMAGSRSDDEVERMDDCYAAVIAVVEGLAGKSAKTIIDEAKASDRGAWASAARWSLALEKGEPLPENKPLAEIMAARPNR